MKKVAFLLIALHLLLLSSIATAQSNVNFFFAACETKAVIDFDGTMGAAGQAGSAAGTVLLVDDGCDSRVLLKFSLAARTAHRQILDGSAEAGQFVTLEVTDGDQVVRFEDLDPDVGAFQQFTLDWHPARRVATQAVAHNQRRIDDGVGEAVFDATAER